MAGSLSEGEMGKPTVLVTRRIPQGGIDLLRSQCDVETNDDDRPYAPEELARRAAGKDALVTLLTDRVDDALLAACPQVKIVANVAVGYDNIDLDAARAHGVTVTNTPGVLTDATADFAFTLLLAAARRVCEADRFVRAGAFHGWQMMGFHGGDLAGRTLGIAGFGRIGQAVARRGRGFGMHVIYTDEFRANAAIEDTYEARYVDKETLIAQSDYLSLHVPYLPSTHHYIGAAELVAMKRTVYLVNTARGPVIDEAALAHALATGEIAGAGLDVFEREPEVHPDLLGLDNVTLAPHIASATDETRTKMAMIAAENVLAKLHGGEPPNIVI
jgi:glyoxylate reductase